MTVNGESIRPAPSPRRRLTVSREALWAYLLLSPSLICGILFVLIPIGAVFAISLSSWNLLTPASYVGLRNYRALGQDPELAHVLKNTIAYAAITTVAKVVLGLGLAYAVCRVRSRTIAAFLESSLFFPVVIPLAIVAMFWGLLFNTDFGAINGLFASVGIGPVPWLSSQSWALPSLMVLDVWKGVGFGFIIYLVALRNVPAMYYEAATLDGAGRWASFRYITLPAVSPITLFVTVINTIGGLQVFDSAYLLTHGGPGISTKTLVYLLWENAFQFLNMGYGSTIAVVLFALIAVVIGAQFALARVFVSYD